MGGADFFGENNNREYNRDNIYYCGDFGDAK